MTFELVLASTSSYRAELLRFAGIAFVAVAPDVDERAFDARFDEVGPDDYVLGIAAAKARSVAVTQSGRLPGECVVLGLDQFVVLNTGDGPRLLHQPGTAQRAVSQLMEMSGSTHELINGVVAIDPGSGRELAAIDRHTITMRTFTRDEAALYVETFAPLDCAGSYRIEDDADLITRTEGEHDSGIIGLPLPLVRRMLVAMESGKP